MDDKYNKGGLANTEHGSIYQLKLLMLFVKIGVEKNLKFRLATELVEAGKFDDLVFLCDDQDGRHRFVQAKHRQDESKKVSANDLLNENDDDFSLQKYLISYRKIKENFENIPEFDKKLKDYIICTNIGLDIDGLKKSKIKTKEIKDDDDFFDKLSQQKSAKRYRLVINEQHKMFEKLRQTSDIYMLAKTLESHIKSKQKFTLQNAFINSYHEALVKENVILKPNNVVKFSDAFVNNDQGLSDGAKKLRELLGKKLNLNTEFEVSETFGNASKSLSKILPSNHAASCKLANTLESYIRGKKTLTLQNSCFKLYHEALVEENVIVKPNNVGKFTDEFVKGQSLSAGAKNLWEILNEKQLDLNTEFEVSKTFGVSVEDNSVNLSYFKSLPNDKIENDEITDFLDKLVLAVDQPNEVELSKIIADQMGHSSAFNLLDAELVTDSFQRHMMDWFKEKEGTWITNESAKEFFKSIEDKVNTLITVGLSLDYYEKIEGFGIKFKDEDQNLKDFLNADTSNVFNIVASESTLLSAIKVQQTLVSLPESFGLKKRDSFIFIRLSKLLRKKIQERVTKAFNSLKSHNLLVIECNSSDNDAICLSYQKLVEILKNTPRTKKIVLISKENDDLANSFKPGIDVRRNEQAFGFTDLDEVSQNKLLEKEVTFQGKKTKLIKLVGQNKENLKETIDTATLVKLIRSADVNIGQILGDLGDTKDYFIGREFNHKVQFHKEKLLRDIKSGKISDLFVISGIDSKHHVHQNIFVLGGNENESKYQELCNRSSALNIHSLKIENENLIWLKSHGSISQLAKYRILDVDRKVAGERDKESKNNILDHKTAIVSDLAGMGKSTVLTDLAMKLKESHPSLWVVRVDLNDYVTILNQEQKKRNANDQSIINQDEALVVDFLVNVVLASQEKTKLETAFEKNLLKRMFTHAGKIALFFDGFDEICPDYKDLVIDLLQKLKETEFERLFVTTRSSMRQVLEEKLNVFSHTLEPFSRENKIEFLTKFWTKTLELNLALNKHHKEALNKYVVAFIDKFCSSIMDCQFIGIPLQMKMLAEVFQGEKSNNENELQVKWQSCWKFIESWQECKEPSFSDKLDLLSLYELFVKKKFYDIHLKGKKGRDFDKPGEKKSADENYENFKERHEILSLALLFGADDLKQLITAKELKKIGLWIENTNEGIIDGATSDNIPHFVHRSFAEYFASFALIERLTSNHSTVFPFVEKMIKNASPVFVMSLTKLINDQDVKIGNQTVLEIVTEKRERFPNIFESFLDINYQDILGKTSLNYAAQNNSEETLDDLLYYKNDLLTNSILKHGKFIKPEYEFSELVKFINMKDKKGKTALYYLVPDAKPDKDNYADYEDSFKLILKGAEIDGLKPGSVEKLITFMLYDKNYFYNRLINRGILGKYADQDNKFRPVQEKLLLTHPDVFSGLCLKDQCRLLSYFFVHGRVTVINALVNSLHDNKKLFEIFKSFDIDSLVNRSEHLSDGKKLEIIEKIVENRDCKNTALYEVRSPLAHTAAQNGHLKTLKFLVENDDSDSFYDLLQVALQCHQMNVVEYLLKTHKEKIKKDGNTALHVAAEHRSVRAIKCLLDRGEDINSKNDDGETPIYRALQRNRKLNFIKYIVEKGADIEIKYNFEDNVDTSLLYYALQKEKYDVAKYLLLERNANVDSLTEMMKKQVKFFRNPKKFDLNHKDQNGSSRLHLAIQLPDLAWSRFLIQQGADVNIKDSEGRTPLHWAVLREQTETVEMLLQFGAMFDASDNNKQTPLDLSPKPGKNKSKIGWLLRVLDILFKSGGGEVLADVCDYNNPVCFILNAQNAKRKSLFHKAAETGDAKAMRTLLQFNDDCLKRKHERNIVSEWIKFKDYQSISLNLKDADGNTPLHIAAAKGFAAIVSQLLGKKGILIAENNDEKTPATLARDNSHEDVARLLEPLEYLFVAVKTGNNLEEVKRLVRLGANINAIDKDNKTLLRYAVISDQIDVVKFLLKKRVNIDEIFKCANPFGSVEKNKCVKLMKKIQKMFNVMQSDSPDKIEDLLKVIRKEFEIDDIRTVINIQDDSGNSILHYAAEANEYEIVCWLLEKGAIFDSVNKSGDKPYRLSSRPVVFNLLRSLDEMFKNIENVFAKSKGFSPKVLVNVRNDNEWTLLHKAASDGEINAVGWLVDNGADVNAVIDEGQTAIYLAQKVIETEEEDDSTSSRHFKVIDFLNDSMKNVEKTT